MNPMFGKAKSSLFLEREIVMEIIILNGIKYIPESVKPSVKECIIRGAQSSVHIGEVESQEGQKVVIKNAKKLWYWKGAFTLNQIAVDGLNRKESRISKVAPRVTMLDAIEIIEVVDGVDLSPCNEN